jgi:hypothetical protein
MKFLSLKELHRLPPLPQGKTSAQARYLTATTTAAQRLRALGESGMAGMGRKAARPLSGSGRCKQPFVHLIGQEPNWPGSGRPDGPLSACSCIKHSLVHLICHGVSRWSPV